MELSPLTVAIPKEFLFPTAKGWGCAGRAVVDNTGSAGHTKVVPIRKPNPIVLF